jgi:outer membrane protein OmpA-like peptidoglycan-associated protein
VETVLVGAILALILAFHQASGDPSSKIAQRIDAAPELVIVVPSADGHVGTVVVERDGERVVLNEAYATSRIVGKSGPQRGRLPVTEVQSRFTSTLTVLPARPISFLLYFVTGTDILTEESKVEFARMLEELRRRPAPDIQVIGHTDTVGAQDANDKLSLQRAERLKADFLAQGIPALRVDAAGRGEREPLVPTGDNVDEPRNRRVEISVR